MIFKMEKVCILLLFVIAGCAIDTGTSVVLDEQKRQTNVQKYSSSSEQISYSSSSSYNVSKFQTDLNYIGIYKSSHGAYLVMKNNTSYKMVVNINYEISCSVNDNPAERKTMTQTFSLEPYEQKESNNSIDNYWHGGMTTIVCTGKILSITPGSRDDSNFQAWTGSYPISTES